jgi:hypothetical protein
MSEIAPHIDLSSCDREPIHIPGSIQPQQKVTIYIEHKGAGFELQHLRAPTETGTLPKGAEQGPKKAKPKAPAKSWVDGILGK